MIDWPALLRSNGIEFVESGPSTAKGNIYCACPWCAGADKGFHLGISTRGKGWGCWKDARHRGRSDRRLLAGLLGIGISQAQAILDGRQGASLAGDDDIMKRVEDMRSGDDDDIIEDQAPLEFTGDIKPILPNGQGRLFMEYLADRGWVFNNAARAIWRYKLRYAMRGAFSYRIVIPIFGEEGLLTWTGRTIAPDIEPRYKTLSVDPEKARDDDVPVARANIKDCLFNEVDLATKMGYGLVVCEGPLDAMRIDYVGSRLGIKGTCLFGKTISDAQLDKLSACAPYFGQKVLLLDRDATMDSYRINERLAPYGFRVAHLPAKYKDPGDMPLDRIETFLERNV